MTTADRVGFSLLLTNNLHALRALSDKLDDYARGRIRCPVCGHTGPHDDNCAPTFEELAFRCCNCGEHFDAVEVE